MSTFHCSKTGKSIGSTPEHLAVQGTRIYMAANDETTGRELHVYDTTNNSTWLAADVRTGNGASMPSEMAVLGSRVYFQATSGSFFEMWVYDSCNNSFWEINNFQSTSGSGGPNGFTVRGNTVFFAGDDVTTGEELWAHNSINETLWQVIDLDPSGG